MDRTHLPVACLHKKAAGSLARLEGLGKRSNNLHRAKREVHFGNKLIASSADLC